MYTDSVRTLHLILRCLPQSSVSIGSVVHPMVTCSGLPMLRVLDEIQSDLLTLFSISVAEFTCGVYDCIRFRLDRSVTQDNLAVESQSKKTSTTKQNT